MFFFAPRGPERIMVFKDLAGSRILIYGYRIVKSGDGYLIQAGPYLIKTREDPESYGEPVSLLDARGPPGIPSPFGLWIRQLIASYVLLAILAISFANTFWITATVYAPAMGVPYTNIDLLSFAALVLSISWFISVLLKSLSPQTLMITLSAIGVSENAIEASPGLDVYTSFPPGKLLKAIDREPKIIISDRIADILNKLINELGDKSLAASILALLGQVYDVWRKSLGLLLQDRYDISVAARARYHLETVKVPKGFLQRYSGILALIAIIGLIILAIIWLQPVVTPVNQTTIPIAPASPPPPPVTSPPPYEPAPPPTPPMR